MKAFSSAFPIDAFHEKQFCTPPESPFSAFGSRSMVCRYTTLAEKVKLPAETSHQQACDRVAV